MIEKSLIEKLEDRIKKLESRTDLLETELLSRGCSIVSNNISISQISNILLKHTRIVETGYNKLVKKIPSEMEYLQRCMREKGCTEVTECPSGVMGRESDEYKDFEPSNVCCLSVEVIKILKNIFFIPDKPLSGKYPLIYPFIELLENGPEIKVN